MLCARCPLLTKLSRTPRLDGCVFLSCQALNLRVHLRPVDANSYSPSMSCHANFYESILVLPMPSYNPSLSCRCPPTVHPRPLLLQSISLTTPLSATIPIAAGTRDTTQCNGTSVPLVWHVLADKCIPKRLTESLYFSWQSSRFLGCLAVEKPAPPATQRHCCYLSAAPIATGL